MDDQFNVRTDDDLFLDDFEPVESEAVPSVVAPEPQTPIEPSSSAPETQPTPAEARPPNPTPRKAASARPHPPASHEPRPRGQLGQSRHAPAASSPNARGGRGQRGRGGGGIGKPHAQAVQQANKPEPAEGSSASAAPEDGSSATPSATADEDPNAPPPNAPTGPAAAQQQQTTPVKPASVTSEARLKSGANPRTKLTDEELSAKMAAMAVASAEKMRRHNQAQRDERDHEMAMARSAEDARKRRAAEQEKRRQAEEDRQRLEDERARNRERKLKAMGAKDGAWEQEAQQEDRRAFTGGANGGVRGSKGLHSGRLGGLQGSKYATGDGDDASEDRGYSNHRGGRGGGRGRGRGGDFGGGGGGRNGQQVSKPAINNEAEFPPLSTKAAPKAVAVETTKKSENPVKMFSPLAPNARWDDEVEAEDARAKAEDKAAA
ncbi:hypothetical protein PpBr36_04230 [Pyricularia pennisetigena]|uniref:hypothetical protein n=1 Tax=Pyricularia pennisetigena TaxID=1578925 RepID=UPI00114E9A37|nr:hypothetical protein PpBr36_04230 [Pyricularia pennisetigena]TLS27428.1 hypothetical protein PpBr36_04230 [Pyricularia pennisetigena]